MKNWVTISGALTLFVFGVGVGSNVTLWTMQRLLGERVERGIEQVQRTGEESDRQLTKLRELEKEMDALRERCERRRHEEGFDA